MGHPGRPTCRPRPRLPAYPNPSASEKLTLTLSTDARTRTVRDAPGRLEYTATPPARAVSCLLPLGAYPAGVYSVRVRTTQGLSALPAAAPLSLPRTLALTFSITFRHMDPSTRDTIIKELTALLEQGNAHVTFADATADVPAELLNQRPDGLPYSLWQLAEHVRIAQWDILEFSRDAGHESPKWPEGYWPADDDHADAARWQATLRQIEQDRAAFLALLRDPARDLLRPFDHGTGQTLLREALLIGDHTAYHTGQIILVRRRLGNWQ